MQRSELKCKELNQKALLLATNVAPLQYTTPKSKKQVTKKVVLAIN